MVRLLFALLHSNNLRPFVTTEKAKNSSRFSSEISIMILSESSRIYHVKMSCFHLLFLCDRTTSYKVLVIISNKTDAIIALETTTKGKQIQCQRLAHAMFHDWLTLPINPKSWGSPGRFCLDTKARAQRQPLRCLKLLVCLHLCCFRAMKLNKKRASTSQCQRRKTSHL